MDKNTLVWVLAFAFLILLSSCNKQEKSLQKVAPAFDIDSVKSYIHKANETYGIRFKEDGSNGLKEKLYCKDAMTMPLGNKSIMGRDSIWAYYYGGGENKDANIVIQATNIYGSESLIVEEGIYDVPDGKGGSYAKGKFLSIWKMEDQIWKMYREIWNTDKKNQ